MDEVVYTEGRNFNAASFENMRKHMEFLKNRISSQEKDFRIFKTKMRQKIWIPNEVDREDIKPNNSINNEMVILKKIEYDEKKNEMFDVGSDSELLEKEGKASRNKEMFNESDSRRIYKNYLEFFKERKRQLEEDFKPTKFKKKGPIFIPREIDIEAVCQRAEEKNVKLKKVNYNERKNVNFDIGSDVDDIEMSFLDEITKLTNPAASLPDVEDDNYDGTLAKTQQKSNGVAVASRPKKFEEIDFEHGKYAGEAVSRRDFFGDVNEISDLKQNAADSDGSDEEIDEEDDVEDEEDNDNSDDEIEGNEEKNSGITHVSLPTEEADSSDNKAECVENQQKIWDDLMYINIRMHALLNVSNQMPRGEARKLLLQSADEKTKENMAEALKNMGKIRKLLKKTVECFEENENDEDDDEEIPSDEDIGELNSENEDEDDEEDDEDDDEGKNIEASKSVDQGVSVGGLANFLKKHDEEYDKFRSATITKWYNRTKLLNTKSANNADFSVFEKGNVITQIKKILNDDQKLLRKVRTNRSGKQRLGRKEENESIDDEIFDDTDFYQILLKQMIESKSNITKNSDDKADMTRSYIELQQLFKNKKKRDVTSLSSKDRKLKYEPIAKLINFYPANPSVVTWTHESRNELFKSLFS